MRRTLISFGIVTIVVFLHVATEAESLRRGTKQRVWEVGGFGGYYFMEGNQLLKDAPSVGGKVGYFFTKALQLQFLFNYNPSEYVKDLQPPFDVHLGGRSVDLFHYRAEMLYHLPIGAGFVPYLALGSGALQLSGAIDNKFDPEFSYGVGMKYFPLEDLSLNADVRGVIPVDKWIHSSADSGWTHYNDIEFLLGVSYLLGRRTAESDGDGVPDDLDGCPDTPRGARVDGKGCPIDSDQDAVPDGIDQCPATPKGASVDERGCPRDTDQDGVEDGLDRCPDSPEGCMVDDRGCPEDSDHDYICNGLDRCPNTPQGCVVDGRGCPLDGDHDGVCDGVDKCPETTAGDRVDAAGCAMLQKEAHILKGITFAYNSARIESLSYPVLNEAAATLKNNPSVRVEIGGHTDSTGSASGNVGLSKMRAEAVKRHLVSKGVPADQMVTKGYGAAQPIASNETREGRAENRRIEFKVLLR